MKRERIVEKVIRKRKSQDIVFLLWYGNRKGKDVDLLLVLKDEVRINCYKMAKWDILEINNKDFKRRLKLFDPVMTEPVMSGVLLFGSYEKFVYLKRKILSICPSVKTIEFLLERASKELENANDFFERYQKKTESQLLLFTLLDLSFACSYFEFARYYRNSFDVGPISFSELLMQGGRLTLKKVVCVFKQAKLNHKINEARINSLIQEVQKTIKGD
ncbi:MAG: hypothetical protein Q8N59_03620 [bacterium]|nr:hypothetical protein [bacterium]